ncbi:MAG: hypothetical protein U0556_01645 [Dehalococcoidia bacterium]
MLDLARCRIFISQCIRMILALGLVVAVMACTNRAPDGLPTPQPALKLPTATGTPPTLTRATIGDPFGVYSLAVRADSTVEARTCEDLYLVTVPVAAAGRLPTRFQPCTPAASTIFYLTFMSDANGNYYIDRAIVLLAVMPNAPNNPGVPGQSPECRAFEPWLIGGAADPNGVPHRFGGCATTVLPVGEQPDGGRVAWAGVDFPSVVPSGAPPPCWTMVKYKTPPRDEVKLSPVRCVLS